MTDEVYGLSFQILREWSEIAVVRMGTEDQEDPEDSSYVVLTVYEKIANTENPGMGLVFNIIRNTRSLCKQRFGVDADVSQILGVHELVIGTDDKFIYLLTRPSDVQFLEDNPGSVKQYQQI